MSVVWFDLVGLTAAAAFCLWIAFPSEGRLRQRGETFARQCKAFVDSEFVPLFNRAATRAFRFWAAFTFVLMVTLVLFDDVGVHVAPSELEILPLAAVLVVVWAGFRLHAAGREFPVPPGRRVVARPRRVVLGDYISLPVRIASWLDVTACVAIAALTTTLAGGSKDVSPAFVTLAVVGAAALVAVTVFVELSGRAMCERPQAAVDPCHLYFQDAWRAEFLQGAYVFVLYGTFLYGLGVTVWLDLPDWLADNAFLYIALVYGAQLAVGYRSRLQFRKRLWPTLAPGQVLLPGEPVPPKVGASA